MKTGYLWIAAWLVFYALGFRTDMPKLFANRGLHIIGKEYYRLFTGLLLHVNLFHLAVNAAGMYFVTGFLNGQTDGWMEAYGLYRPLRHPRQSPVLGLLSREHQHRRLPRRILPVWASSRVPASAAGASAVSDGDCVCLLDSWDCRAWKHSHLL